MTENASGWRRQYPKKGVYTGSMPAWEMGPPPKTPSGSARPQKTKKPAK